MRAPRPTPKIQKPEPVIIIVTIPGVIVPAAPAVDTGASISGAETPMATLTGTPATFTGTNVVVTNSWRKNGSATGSTGLSYSDTADGDSIVFRSTGTNAGGSAYDDSDAFVVVEEEAEGSHSLQFGGRDESAIETGFRDEYSTESSTGSWTTLNTVGASTGVGLTFDATYGVFAANTRYWVRRVAYNGVGDALNNPVVEFYTAPDEVPSNVAATTVSSTSILVEWDSVESPVNGGFKIYRDDVLIDVSAADARSYTASGLTAETLYGFKVQPYNSNPNQNSEAVADSEGPLSAEASATTDEFSYDEAILALTPALWVDFDDAHATTGQWDDKSGNANHLLQAVSGSRPTRVAADLNGHDVFSWDGTADHIRTAPITASELSTSGTSFSIFMLFRPSEADTKAHFDWNSGTSLVTANIPWTNGLYVDAGNNTNARVVEGVPSGWLDAWHLIELTRDGNYVTLYADGTALDSVNTASGSLSGTSELSLGSWADGSGGFAEMKVAQYLWLPAAVSGASRTMIKAYMAERYGLTLA